jgi:hypothetical protein
MLCLVTNKRFFQKIIMKFKTYTTTLVYVLRPPHLHFQLTLYYEPLTKLYFLNNIGVVRGDHEHIHSITMHYYTHKNAQRPELSKATHKIASISLSLQSNKSPL